MGIFNCEYTRNCERRPHIEMHWHSDDGESHWCYVCFWHYLIARIRKLLKLNDFGWCRVDTDREAVEYLRCEPWDIHQDLAEIKEKLGIKNESLEELERNLDVT